VLFALLSGIGLDTNAYAATEAVSASAQPTGSIVITGTRTNRAAALEPYAIEVIDREQLERELPRTVPEALNRLPGVLVQKTASGHGSPYIRGFTGNRTLLVIDGIRYNNATFRDGANEYFAQIDSFTLSQVELIAGPSSALYGSEAVGGVINLTTRSSGLFEESGAFATGEQVVRFSSGDGSVVSRSAIGFGQGGAWGFRGGVTLRDYGDIRAADIGSLPYTGYNEYAFDARLDVVLSERWTATANHQLLDQSAVPRTHSTVFSIPFAGTTIGTDVLREKDHHRNLTYLKLAGDLANAAVGTVELTLAHQSRNEIERRVLGTRARIDQGFDSDMLSLSAVATSQVGRAELTYGLDLSREKIDSARRDTDPASGLLIERLQGPIGDLARFDQAGVFVRGVHSLSDAFSLDASVRITLIDVSVGQFADPVTGQAIAFDSNWSNLSGSVRGRWSREGHTLWTGYSRSFRAPNVADISRFGRSRTNEVEVASLALEPETFDTFELAYRYRSDRVQAGLTAYSTMLNDYIATVPTGRLRNGLVEVSKRNAAKGHIHGVELSLSASLGGGVNLDGNATWLRGRLTTPTAADSVEQPISRIQPLMANLAVSWEEDGSWIQAALTIAGRADQLSSGDLLDTQRIPPGGTPGYALLNIGGGFELVEGVTITLALNNLLDEAYRTHGSGNNEPGRHLISSLHMRF